MNAATERARQWWRQREPRERWMLAAMCAAIAAFVFWYALLAPLRGVRDGARTGHAQATLELARTRLELARLHRMAQDPAPPIDAGALRRAVLDSAAKAGLAVARERDLGGGGVGIEADAASPAQLFAWLDALRSGHGLAPSRLSAAKSEGRLRVQADFEPEPGGP